MIRFLLQYFVFMRCSFSIGGILGSIAAPIIGGLFGSSGQREANAANARQAHDQMQFQAGQTKEQMEFQERMANTAHQRQVADLRAAGLNPVLSVTGGGGAPSPGGASASGAQARMESVGGAAVQAAHSAQSAKMMREQIENVREQNKNIAADTELKHTQRVFTSQQWNTSRAEEGLKNEQAAVERIQAEILGHQAKGAKVEGDIDESKYGAVLRYLDRLNPFGNTARRYLGK